MSGLLAIITINYNDLEGLKKTIDSVEPQLSEDVDWVIVDGGSLDGSVDLIREQEKHFSFWVSEKDDGIYDAMNKGLKFCSAKYVWFINSGDYLRSGSISQVLKKLKHSQDAKLVLCGGYVRYSDMADWYRKPRSGSDAAFHSIPALNQSTIYRRSDIPFHGYPSSYRICGYHWMAAFFMVRVSGVVEMVDQPISIHPIHGGAAISNLRTLFCESWLIQKEIYRGSLIRKILSSMRRIRSVFLAKILSNKFLLRTKLFRFILRNKLVWLR